MSETFVVNKDDSTHNSNTSLQVYKGSYSQRHVQIDALLNKGAELTVFKAVGTRRAKYYVIG